jgi:hypothetical protein
MKAEVGSDRLAWQKMDELDPCQQICSGQPSSQCTHEDSKAPNELARSVIELPVLQASFSSVSYHVVGYSPAKQKRCPRAP